MNRELIKKLKMQATSHTWNGDGVTEELDEELFAELIVQECMSINRQRLFPDYEGDSHQVAHNNALICANSDLQRHFGVDQ